MNKMRRIEVRVSEQQYGRIKALAESMGFTTISSFIREKTLNEYFFKSANKSEQRTLRNFF